MEDEERFIRFLTHERQSYQRGRGVEEQLMNTTVNCSFFVSGKFNLHENFAIPNQ